MERLWEIYGNFQSARGRIGGLPSWARGLVFIAALPGVVLIALSVIALLVSILALLLLTVPLYRVLRLVTGKTTVLREPGAGDVAIFGFPGTDGGDLTSPGRKKVDVTIIE